MRYIDLLLKGVAVKPEELAPPTDISPPELLRQLSELHKSEGWALFRKMVENQVFTWERRLVDGTGDHAKDAAVRSAIHTAVGLLTWPEREANRLRDYMEAVKNGQPLDF